MTTRFHTVCIVGAGAIGGWLGAGLARAGCAVSMLARGQTLAALQRDGLRLHSGPSDAPVVQTHQVLASPDPRALGPQDLVIVAVKAPAMREVALQLAPLLRPDTVVLTAMNGLAIPSAGKLSFSFLTAAGAPLGSPWDVVVEKAAPPAGSPAQAP